jgi:hypothetical protein
VTESKETRQIREAFIDGYMSDFDSWGRSREDAERAWRAENETHSRQHPAAQETQP